MKSILDGIGKQKGVTIDETYTKPQPNDKKFTKFNDIAPQMANFNHQANILILPKTKDEQGNQ